MNSREDHISVADYGEGEAKKARVLAPEAHSFTPLLSEFAGDQWRKGSEGIYTQAWASGDGPDEAGFKIRVFATPRSADSTLRTLLPIVVEENYPFKVIANSALLELAYFNWPPESPAGAFLTVYPPSESAFNELAEKFKVAANGIKVAPPASPSVPVEKTNPLTTENPWPGSRPYLPGEAAYFFGFEDEQAELVRRLGRGALTILLGAEKSGKSSLAQAGLTDALGRANMAPIYVRLKFNGAVHPVQQVRDAINRVLTERQIDATPFGEGQTLRDYFHAQPQPWLDADKKPVVPVLVFDQFEDVFAIDGENQAFVKPVDVFWTQIGNLIENRGRDSGKAAPSYSDPRNDQVAFKALICLRQDKLPKLQSRRGLIPSISQNQFSLKPFTGQRAMQAVLNPGKNLFDAADAELLAEEIVRLIGNESPQSVGGATTKVDPNIPLEWLRVEPALLSFFCQQLNEARSHSGEAVITAKLIEAEAGRIFARFFNREEPIEIPAPVPTPKVEQKAPAEPEVVVVPAKAPEKIEALVVQAAPTIVAPPSPEPKAAAPVPMVAKTVEVLPAETPKIVQEQKVVEPAVVVPAPTPARIETPPVEKSQTIPEVSIPEPKVQQIVAVAPPVAEIPKETKPKIPESKPHTGPTITATPVKTAEATKTPAPIASQPVKKKQQPAKPEPAKPAVQKPKQTAQPPAQQTSGPTPSQAKKPEARPTPVAVAPQPTIQYQGSIKEIESLPVPPKPAIPDKAPVPVVEGDGKIRRLRFLMAVCGVALIVMLTVMVVTHVEEVQRQQTEHELEEFVSHLAATRKTFNAAHKQLSIAEANLALKESNIMALTAQSRETQSAARNAEERNTKFARERSDYESRIKALTAERDKAETRVAQWSSLLNDLTNQIQTLSKENSALETRNHHLAQVNDSRPVVTNETRAATNAPGNFSLTMSRPASQPVSTPADEKQAAAMASPSDKLAAPFVPDSDPSSRRSVDILLAHGQCLYSENGGSFQPLVLRQNVHQGAVIKTGKGSWCDLIVRRAGTTIRLAPDSAIKISNLSLGTQNGLPVINTSLELSYGRLFSIVRALVPGSTLEFSDGAGHSVVEGGGLGSYMITAPKPDFGEKLSVVPLRVFTQNGNSVLAPNQEYNARDGNVFSLTASTWETTLLHLDELEAEADKASAQTETPKPAQ